MRGDKKRRRRRRKERKKKPEKHWSSHMHREGC
jgi:hypothetical protein